MSLDGFSMSPLVTELHTRLVGGRIDKIFQIDKYTLIFWIRQYNENLRLLISVNPEQPCIHLAAATPENPPVPPSFCMLLRKHLEDGRIGQICQHNLDRIVKIDIDIRGEQGNILTKSLVVELMGKHSNIIFMHDNTIIDAIKRVGDKISRVRQILPGRTYNDPPGQSRINLLTTPAIDLLKTFDGLTGQLSKIIINNSIGIGPVTAKEIAWRAGLPPNIAIESLDNADFNALQEAMDSIIQPLKEGTSMPTVVFDDNNRLVGIAAYKLEHLQQYTSRIFATMSEAVEFATKLKGVQHQPDKDLLKKILSAELARLQRKQLTLSQEREEAELADELRKYADILMANLYNIPARTPQVTLPDLFSEQPEDSCLTIGLDPLLSPLENAQRYYTKYNKLKRAQNLLWEQLEKCNQEIKYLDSINVALGYAATSAEIAEIRQELVTAGYINEPHKRRLTIQPSVPLTTITADGFTILVGKNNKQNDLVTFKHARPDDFWFHTKDIPGAHVILRTNSQHPSQSAIMSAANLAAFFSKARQSANIPVDYTQRRNVKKPSGAKPGFVIYEHQNTIFVTPDENLIHSLIKI